jgi:hypothetical protein
MAALALLSPMASADVPRSLDIKSGFGEELYVKHGLLGTKDTEMKDRLGDSFKDKHGILSSDHDLNVLGNSYSKHHGLLSGNSVEMRSILGDRIESKKTFFGLGPRKTTVDLSGVSSIVQQIAGKNLASMRMTMPGMGTGMGIGPGVGSTTLPGSIGAGSGFASGFQFPGSRDADLGAAQDQMPAPMETMPKPYGP